MNRQQKLKFIKGIIKGSASISELRPPEDLFLIIWKYDDASGYYCWNFSHDWTEVEFHSYLEKHPKTQFYQFTTSRKMPLFKNFPKNQNL